jgi:hypothetical protein
MFNGNLVKILVYFYANIGELILIWKCRVFSSQDTFEKNRIG